jgi:regulator of sigma E protease
MDKGEEVPKELEDKSYENKPQYKKFLVIIGGVAFNILIAVLLIAVFLSMGVYKPTNTIDYIQPGSPAEEHNLQIGDKVTALDGKEISSWEEFSTITKNAEDRNVTYTIIRDGEKKKINVSLDMRDGDKFLGVSPKTVKEYLSFTEVVKQSFTMTWDITKTYGQLIGMLVRGELSFSEARPVSPVGVISIFQQSASMGIQNFILFIALVSLLLGFGNLIPILPLDGGHIVVLIIESIRGRPVSKKVLEVITSIGIFLLVSLLIVGFVYDIISPFNINNM